MAGWNKPSAANQPVKKGGAKAPSKVKGVVAGLVTVCALGGLCLWMFSGGEDAPKAKVEKERGRIKEVTPAKAPTNKVAIAKKPEKNESKPQRVGEVRNGYRLLCDGRLQKVTEHVITSYVGRTTMVGRLFEHAADQFLACALLAEPGGGMIGDSEETYRNFNELFEDSLKHEIVDLETDSEEDKQIKASVRELRKELIERAKAGEDPKQIMINNRNQLMELATYYSDIEAQVKDIVKKNGKMTDADRKELIGAANKMLEDRGCKPLELSEGLLFQIQRTAQRELEKQEGQEGAVK